MANAYERKVSAQGLTVKLYRGEGVCLLAFDLEKSIATHDFSGFSIEVKYPGAQSFIALANLREVGRAGLRRQLPGRAVDYP